MTASLPIDFGQIIAELRARMTLHDIAAAIGEPESTVRYCRYGVPKHPLGEKLIALYLETLGNTRDELPRTAGLPAEI